MEDVQANLMDAIADAVSAARDKGLDHDSIISALELAKMAAEDEA